MIVVDLFIGATIPALVGDEKFLLDVKRALTTHGKLLVNYLYEREYKRLSDYFFTMAKKIFPGVSCVQIYFNRFFYVVK